MRKEPALVEKVTFRDLALSRLMLGTVQLGMSYGIANRAGRPAAGTAREIVSAAWEGGVNCFDTAAAYGESEAVLGDIFATAGPAVRPVLVSKIRALEPGLAAPAAAAAIRQSLAGSLARLRLARLPFCLFHREDDAAYLPALLALRDQGLIGAAGVSVYRPEVALELIGRGTVDAIQLPASVLDHRFRRAGVFEAAAAAGVAVFVRSVYLQGLLFLAADAIPPALAAVRPVRRRLAALAREAGMAPAELAVRYVLGLPGVTCVLVGVETVGQLRENLAVFARGRLEAPLRAAVERAVPALPEEILLPPLWPRREGP